MGKRLDISVEFQNEDELKAAKDAIVAAVNEALESVSLNKPGVTLKVDVIEDDV